MLLVNLGRRILRNGAVSFNWWLPRDRVLSFALVRNASVNLQVLTQDSAVRKYLDSLSVSSFENVDPSVKASLTTLLSCRDELKSNLKELEELEKQCSDDKMKSDLKAEREQYYLQLDGLDEHIIATLLPPEEHEDCHGTIFEISAGVGGQEAMLFAADLYNLYRVFFDNNGWSYDIAALDKTDLGGIRFASLLVSGVGAYSKLKYEAGVHRVQRVPKTEKTGRIHTSTATVAVLPQPNDLEVNLSDRDLIIETKRATGAGGQHVNTTDSAVRITHIPTRIVVECQTERSQIKNKQIALKKLAAKIYERMLDDEVDKVRSLRKAQVGTKARSDKVRTYNFNQDRITDHRLSVNFSSLQTYFEGGPQLESIIDKLQTLSQQERLNEFLQSVINNKDS